MSVLVKFYCDWDYAMTMDLCQRGFFFAAKVLSAILEKKVKITGENLLNLKN
jgi:hypothetical protein